LFAEEVVQSPLAPDPGLTPTLILVMALAPVTFGFLFVEALQRLSVFLNCFEI
jgi:hypothetical protein